MGVLEHLHSDWWEKTRSRRRRGRPRDRRPSGGSGCLGGTQRALSYLGGRAPTQCLGEDGEFLKKNNVTETSGVKEGTAAFFFPPKQFLLSANKWSTILEQIAVNTVIGFAHACACQQSHLTSLGGEVIKAPAFVCVCVSRGGSLMCSVTCQSRKNRTFA